jgi:hypothetical protein
VGLVFRERCLHLADICPSNMGSFADNELEMQGSGRVVISL